MEELITLHWVVGILFTICYLYQFMYIPVPWLLSKRKRPTPTDMSNKYAILICARNEEKVIATLIESLFRQTYKAENLHIFVLADNCTDNTASVARAAGADVYERRDTTHTGKGYALASLLCHLEWDYPEGFDGYFVFDADNVLKPDYIEQMDRVFSDGNEIVTSYRNSKNYGNNWISAGYALWFLRESRYLNHARYLLGTSCAISGTGFMFSRSIAEELGGWPFHMLTEDIQFSIYQVIKGRKIAFCPDAELFDEQPVKFSQSWRQRLRWSRGFLQVFKGYGSKLAQGALRGCFSCFDMTMTIMPALILSAFSVICDIIYVIWSASHGANILISLLFVCSLFTGMYMTLFAVGMITTITEWRHIHTTTFKKLFYTVTFPIFLFTYIPISITALFVDPGWKPINHSVNFKLQPSSEGVLEERKR